MQHIRRRISGFSFLVLPVLLVLLVFTSSGFGSRGTAPQILPPYDYVSDGDLVQSCKLFLLDKTSASMCPHYIQGFMDGKFSGDRQSTAYCVPENFQIDHFIRGYIDRFEGLKGTSLYDTWKPASSYVNMWFDEYFACQDSGSEN